MTTPPIAFRKGGDTAEAAEEEARKVAQARRSSGPEYFSLAKDGEQIVIRLLTDDPDVIWVDQHSFVPTKDAPKDAENWPASMTAVCRKDKAFAGHFAGCFICDNKIKNRFGKTSYPNIRIWALAVERELVKGDGTEALGGPSKLGVVVAVQDKIIEVEELDADGNATGTTLRYPKIIIVNQPVNNFYGHFRAMYGLHKTLTDRDYIVTRKGSGTETTYEVTSIDPIPTLKPGTPAWARYEEALVARKIDLGQLVFDKAGDVYYARFFDPKVEVDQDGKIVPAGTAAKAPVQGIVDLGDQDAPAPQASALGSTLRDQIRSMGKPQASESASTDDEQPPY